MFGPGEDVELAVFHKPTADEGRGGLYIWVAKRDLKIVLMEFITSQPITVALLRFVLDLAQNIAHLCDFVLG